MDRCSFILNVMLIETVKQLEISFNSKNKVDIFKMMAYFEFVTYVEHINYGKFHFIRICTYTNFSNRNVSQFIVVLLHHFL